MSERATPEQNEQNLSRITVEGMPGAELDQLWGTFEGVPEEHLDRFAGQLGELAADFRLTLSVQPQPPFRDLKEIKTNPGNYNPELVSYLMLAESGRIPILPTHKLQRYAWENGYTELSFSSDITRLHYTEKRPVTPEGRYTYSRILRADRLEQLLADISKDPDSFPFLKKSLVEFLEACAADLKLRD